MAGLKPNSNNLVFKRVIIHIRDFVVLKQLKCLTLWRARRY